MANATFSADKLKQLTLQITKLARVAGDFQINELKNFERSNIEHKGRSNDLVSYVDKETEKLLIESLTKLVPEAGFETEEGTVEQTQSGLRWIIDPLDGTTNFLHKLPLFSISIALVQDETLLIGVVHEPSRNECFYAWKNGGAYMNGERIETSSITEISDALIATGFPYSLRGKSDQYFTLIRHFVETTHGVRRLGSAAIDLCYVACGRFEAYFEFNLKPWDVAAGILIVREAGGIVSNYSGGDDHCQTAEEVCAAGRHIHPLMIDTFKKIW
ncbi:inositol monophosphatase family protein [Cytophaga hutchinsonii]|uniref:Inositol-1-monophosphatase n=1 Tax=Cytophaga hutchinsonii (strain ATCC 33406 / DSM 1761 / CIP 103989 / NBRC 15051 / NCIMB 9469 / D465) TaxID=269798 RepID=A0A6N4SVK6_CYTH3|nr:inositol monophosphatase family protein [Cytophaga hutchinsonii]ABG60497.1 inositol-1-monophosphatase [Cytophaga hutchinsonii ATCC 33406]SFX84701.1 myo-inositol-1(or 4)-monophosphatase [Cytophaga hutchinsonii ATCC 33406]